MGWSEVVATTLGAGFVGYSVGRFTLGAGAGCAGMLHSSRACQSGCWREFQG